MATKTQRRKVPVSQYETDNDIQMSEVYCVNPACNKYLCYEAIEIGIIKHQCHSCKTVTQFSRVPGDDDTAPEKMRKVRCGQCGRFLYEEAIIAGTVKTKCGGCKRWNTLIIGNNIVQGKSYNT